MKTKYNTEDTEIVTTDDHGGFYHGKHRKHGNPYDKAGRIMRRTPFTTAL